MDQILSQDEIDDLLSSVQGGDKPSGGADGNQLPGIRRSMTLQKNVGPYDFKHPDRITKDIMRALRTIHEGFARIMGTFLSSTMRSLVEINLLSMDQVTYAEYKISLPELSCIYVVGSNNYNGSMIVELSPQFVLYIVDRLLGGTGERLSEPREITMIEQSVIARTIDRFVESLNDVWDMVQPMRLRMETFESNPQFVQIAPASESIALIFFEIRVMNFSFPLNICIPYFLLEPVLPFLTQGSRMSLATRPPTSDSKRKVIHKLQCSGMTLKALLGSTEVSVSDYLRLKPGDVLPLAVSEHADLPLEVGGMVKFLGRPGSVGIRKAFRISREVTQIEDPIHNDKNSRLFGGRA